MNTYTYRTMGLFGEHASEEMDAKDKQIADLQAQQARRSSKETTKVAASDKIIDDGDGGSLNAVSVKLPPFTESNPELWFGKAEAQFVLRGVKDDTTKFYHLYANLTQFLIIKNINRAASILASMSDYPGCTGTSTLTSRSALLDKYPSVHTLKFVFDKKPS